jgi:hypothetical protein
MVTASFISHFSQTVDWIESQSQPRPWKVVQIPVVGEDPGVARDRHYAGHPEDRGAQMSSSSSFTMMKEGPTRAGK